MIADSFRTHSPALTRTHTHVRTRPTPNTAKTAISQAKPNHRKPTKQNARRHKGQRAL